MVFCITYALACVCITFPLLPILLVGRFLGGVSTSILFSAFESWLISSASSASLPSADLSAIMGRATLVNGIVATTAGVVSNQLVESTKNYVVPFIASGALLILGWCVIRGTWTENYGATSVKNDDLFQVKRLGVAWDIVRQGQ
jgi:MFS family permease